MGVEQKKIHTELHYEYGEVAYRGISGIHELPNTA